MKQVQGRLDMVSSLWCKDTCSHFRGTCHCILTQSLTTAQNAAYNIFSAQHIYVIHYGSCSRKPPAFVSSIAYHYDEFRPAVKHGCQEAALSKFLISFITLGLSIRNIPQGKCCTQDMSKTWLADSKRPEIGTTVDPWFIQKVT